MRGPMVRLKLDVRRLWRCPECGYERKVPANQSTVRCHCDNESHFMKLIEEQRPARPVPEELPPYYEFEDEAALAENVAGENESGEKSSAGSEALEADDLATTNDSATDATSAPTAEPATNPDSSPKSSS